MKDHRKIMKRRPEKFQGFVSTPNIRFTPFHVSFHMKTTHILNRNGVSIMLRLNEENGAFTVNVVKFKPKGTDDNKY